MISLRLLVYPRRRYMSPTCNSSLSARRVTDVAEIVDAIGIESVCTDGTRVALRFSTRRGIIVVQCSLKVFIEKARAPLDSNNQPFALRKPTTAQLEADAQQVPITKGHPDSIKPEWVPHRLGKNGLSVEQVKIIRAAWLAAKGGEFVKYTAVAAIANCSVKTVSEYFSRFDALAEIQPDAPPSAPFQSS